MCYEWKKRFACGHVGFHKVERCHALGSGCFGPDGSERFLDVDGLCYDCTARLQDPTPTTADGDPFREGADTLVGRGGGDGDGRGSGSGSGGEGGAGGRKRNAPTESSPRTTRSSTRAAGRGAVRRTAAGRDGAVPDIYRQMVTEARAEINAQDSAIPERPLKRRRPGEGRPTRTETPKSKVAKDISSESSKANTGDASDDNLLFEDVVLPAPTVQTMTRDSDEEDDDDIDFEDVAIEAGSSLTAAGKGSRELNLDLSAHMAALAPRRSDRRKAISREEKERRVDIHKAHLVCLLAHVELRNRWCNDRGVQDALRPLIPQKTVSALIPRASLNQFGRSESLRKGVQEAKELFKVKFTITERGLRRALWAEDEEQLKDYQLPDDMESTLEKSDFLEAAKTLRGSRDVGTQLFCSLLRSVGVEARLVCSLQPLSCVPGAPTMPKQRKAQTQTPQKQPSKFEIYAAVVAKHETKYPDFQASATTPSPRRRLGHPHAAAYHPPSITPPSQPSTASASQAPKPIRGESPFPVYWVEVLDVAHQSWHPVDPLVTGTQWKPRVLEPPASDTLNTLTYAIAFEADASARDVTRRYAKAYTSKTRRQRIDGLPAPTNPPPPPPPPPPDPSHPLPGARWYRLALKRYTRPHPTDLDQIERNELAAAEAREPMPRNVADFKDHPVYALARHLRRGEALVPGAQASGTVSAGAKAPLERIYRRADVRVVRSRERWYRLGRVVRPGEEPVKSWVRPRRRRGRGVGDGEGSEGEGGGGGEDGDDDDPDRVGLFGDAARGYTPLYMMEQTDAYVAPPVVGGKVPKNKFGNLDLYVPSMLPRGGVHVRHERAAQAAFILGVDYAPALTGFEFRGRHGTAVLNGVVVPEEAGEGVWAVIEGLEDMEAEEEQERRSRRALWMWSRFLKGMRIRERVWAGVDEEAEEEEGEAEDKGKGKEVEVDEDVGMEDVSEDDMGGGGFFVPDEDDDDDDGGGGKMGGRPPSQPTATPLPINWPSHIPYLAAPSYSPHLTPAHLRDLRTRPEDPSDPLPEIPRDLKPGPCPSVRITPITDPAHPAHGQAGLFATRDLAPGALILPYLGEVHIGTAPFGRPPNGGGGGGGGGSGSDQDGYYDYAGSDYDLWLDRDADLAVDAARAGNEARFVNDYRGVPGRGGRKANAEFRVVWDGRRGERCMAVFVLPAGKRATGRARVVGVARGEEVLVSYGRGFWQGRREEEDVGGDGDGEGGGSEV
ncbi:hypothetical protein B0I37DRAFT_330281 [Chaetomium sp. MPI-CAGE-AT-0009]|nr:hypothetical protein B0I37DRAFT_330281 [Chaetomium sp. MPI-CAGE-AT-0009]